MTAEKNADGWNLGHALKASSMRSWSLKGKNRLVKVVSPVAERVLLNHHSAMGYVTQEKYLYGKNCSQIEQLLGLRPHELHDIAYVYALAALPDWDEFEFKLTCIFPDGADFDDKKKAVFMKARADYKAGLTPLVEAYPPGSAMIPQWKLIKPIKVAGRIAAVTRTQPFPRQNGSIQPYRRYGKEIR